MGANGVLKLFCWCSWIFHDFIHNVGHCVTKVPTRNVERKSVPEQICVIRFQNEFHVKRVPNKMPGESKVNNAGLCLYPHRICVYILSPTKASQSGLADFFFFFKFLRFASLVWMNLVSWSTLRNRRSWLAERAPICPGRCSGNPFLYDRTEQIEWGNEY
jgi:hypothetical protein